MPWVNSNPNADSCWRLLASFLVSYVVLDIHQSSSRSVRTVNCKLIQIWLNSRMVNTTARNFLALCRMHAQVCLVCLAIVAFTQWALLVLWSNPAMRCTGLASHTHQCQACNVCPVLVVIYRRFQHWTMWRF